MTNIEKYKFSKGYVGYGKAGRFSIEGKHGTWVVWYLSQNRSPGFRDAYVGTYPSLKDVSAAITEFMPN